ncbi:MAG TPA: site-2 protease family protein [Acidimicrobiales bacterium]|jgi:Zn-dependent protease|nr:site-2 protease family protein [Acidimicrobiales bacterium]
MDQRTKSTLWILAGAVLLIALVAHHNITSQEIIIFCVIVPSIILHEVSHGVVANAFGDDTAKRAGRLTLNPVPHVDPVGTLLVPALLSLSGAGFFGWAKPVPVNVGRLRSPRNQGVLVSLVGPATNAALAAIFGLVFVHFVRSGLPVNATSTAQWSTVAQIVFFASLLNVGLCAFNLVPIPPLDGSVLFERVLPARYWPTYLRYRQYTMPILLGLVVLNFFLNQNGHTGPITWFFDELYNWWQSVLGV